MERVKKGERYWYIDFSGFWYTDWLTDYGDEINTLHFITNNYFHTKEEAETMAEKLRAVLEGAEVIEMPSEEDIKAVAIRHCGPLAQWSGSTVDAFIEGAEYGYKEAIAMAKEWIQKNVPIIHTEEGDYVRVNMGHKNVPMNKYLADFETDMNKLWEGEK